MLWYLKDICRIRIIGFRRWEPEYTLRGSVFYGLFQLDFRHKNCLYSGAPLLILMKEKR